MATLSNQAELLEKWKSYTGTGLSLLNQEGQVLTLRESAEGQFALVILEKLNGEVIEVFEELTEDRPASVQRFITVAKDCLFTIETR